MSKPQQGSNKQRKATESQPVAVKEISRSSIRMYWALAGGVLLGLSQLHSVFTLFSFFAITPLILALLDGYFTKRRIVVLVLTAFLLPYSILSNLWLFPLGGFNAVFIILLSTLIAVVAFFPLYLRRGDKSLRLVCSTLLIAWLGIETLQLHWAFAYPLQSLGVNLLDFPAWVQWYAWTGATGGTAWILLVNVGLAICTRLMRGDKTITRWGAATAAALILPLCLSYWELARFTTAVKPLFEPLSVTVLHPNLDCYGARSNYPAKETAVHYANMMRTALEAEKTDLLLLPENALLSSGWLNGLNGIDLNPDYQAMQVPLAMEAPPKVLVGAVVYEEVLAGAALHPLVSYDLAGNFYYRTYNAIVEIGSETAKVVRTKQHLVPFEETVPLAETLGNTLSEVGKQVGRTGNRFGSLNDGKNTFTVAGTNVLSLICYESLFGATTASIVADKRANLITVHLNEGWYDNYRGARLFEKHAQARAIENHKPVARSSNRGSSGFISATGEISQHTYSKSDELALNKKVWTNRVVTPYSRLFARVSGWIWLCIFVAAYVGVHRFVD